MSPHTVRPTFMLMRNHLSFLTNEMMNFIRISKIFVKTLALFQKSDSERRAVSVIAIANRISGPETENCLFGQTKSSSMLKGRVLLVNLH